MDLGLRDRVCVVSGASRGIGKATAVALAAEGATVLLVGRSEDALSAAARECTAVGPGGRTEVMTLDVTTPDAGDRVVQECLGRFGRIDALVNNAGTSALRTFEQLTDEEWQAQWDVHVMAPMRLMRAAAPVRADRGWGRIVNISSSSGKRPSKTNMAYSVTKAAQLSLSRVFADQYASQGVLVNAVAPGPTATELWTGESGIAAQAAARSGSTREDELEAAGSKVPIGRLGEPEEIAAVIVVLCSEQASNVAGASWSVDGGAVPFAF
jgi:NAD(P)-dependent dehydrogenase (short-subunit alcohol dehydrogenase family)